MDAKSTVKKSLIDSAILVYVYVNVNSSPAGIA